MTREVSGFHRRRSLGGLWLALGSLVLGCGGASGPGASEPHAAPSGPSLFAPVAAPAGPSPVAPRACREVTFREIPAQPGATAGVPGDQIETVSTATGFAVVRAGVSGTRTVFWNAVTNAWRDVGEGPETYRPGDVGPMSGAHWLAVGDAVVMIWHNESRRPGLQAAIADRDAGRYDELPLTSGPTTETLRAVDSAGRLIVFAGPGLAGGWRLDPAARTWAPITMEGRPAANGNGALVALGDRVLMLGAAMVGEGSVGALYDPQADSWTPIAEGPTPELGFTAAFGDAFFWWRSTEPRSGAVYTRSSDAWQVVGATGAPYARPSGLPLFGFTGTHLVHAEVHREDMGRPRDPAAVFDVAAGTWRRVPIPPTFGDPYTLPDGRVVFFGHGSAQPIVIDPRTGLVCTPSMAAVPTVGTTPAALYSFAGVVGDELVLFGRTDTGSMGSPCPPGAPCVPTEMWASTRDDGVAIRF